MVPSIIYKKKRNNQNILGQFFTPTDIATFMAKWISEIHPRSVLDPAVGSGIFFEKIEKLSNDIILSGYDVDENILVELSNNHPEYTLYNEDFLLSTWDTKYDGIICNPPYNRFQHYANKNELSNIIFEKMGINIIKYSNIYVLFLLKALYQLENGGRCAFIIPYEFLNTRYGVVIKQYLVRNRLINDIILFKDMLLFEGVITTSCILLLEKSEKNSVNFINISNTNDYKKLICNKYNYKNYEHVTYKYNSLNPDIKWINYYNENLPDITVSSNLVKLSEYGSVKRGIATGCNNYFLINKSTIFKNNLSETSLSHCVGNAKHVNNLFFTMSDLLELASKDKRVFLFDGCKSTDDATKKYIQLGEKSGVNERYLTSHRNPWYAIESKKTAPIWISVFSRNHFKFVRNEAGALNLSTFHGFYPSDKWKDDIPLLYSYLISDVAERLFTRNIREYGNKLYKFEPNDLNTALALNLTTISEEDKDEIRSLYYDLRENYNDHDKTMRIVERINTIFNKYI